jgi:hypothetical protein
VVDLDEEAEDEEEAECEERAGELNVANSEEEAEVEVRRDKVEEASKVLERGDLVLVRVRIGRRGTRRVRPEFKD